MSLASLPQKIPFNLGGLVRPTDTRAAGFTGLLPQRLPFTLSAKVPVDYEVDYGTVGWELVCRSYTDYQTILLRTTDMNSLTFSRELGAYGMASFSLNLDHVLFKQALNDGSPVESLFEYEHLWEIRFDGQAVFQILGTAVTDTFINDAETRTATVSGSGTGRVLEWAQIFPTGFPDKIVTKLETLVDAFSGDALDRTIWTNTAVTSTISITNSGGWAEEQGIIDVLTQELESLTQAQQAATQEYNTFKAEYAIIMKAKTSTEDEKDTARLNLLKGLKGIASTTVAVSRQTGKIDTATERRNFYGQPKMDDLTGFLKLNLTQAGTTFATSKSYDFDSSGISGGVQPAPTDFTQAGQASTIFKVMHDPGNFTDYYIDTRNHARLYTQKISGNHRLVAEVSSNNDVLTKHWAYDVVSQKFWRIREDSGYIIFETSPDNSTWVQRFKAQYNWPTKNVVFQFGLDYQGTAGIDPPLSAYLFGLNLATLPSTETAMQKFRQYLTAAQSRGVIPYVTTDFTDSVDSQGRAWAGKLATDLNEGTKLSEALESLTQVQQADWIMDTDFKLKVYQRIKADEVSPPVLFKKSDVVFHEAGSQIQKERSRSREGIANAIVGKNASGQYAYIQDEDSIEKYQRREAFISAGTATDLTDLAAVLDSSLEELKAEKTSWKITVAADQPGRRLFKDYSIGDWISIQNIDNQGAISVGEWRVVGIAINVAQDATQTVELTLQSRRELLIERLKQQVSNMSPSSSAGSSTSIGTAIGAVSLIEQLTLSGLRDVVIENPVEGDVLTYSNGYWIPVTPGDKTVPNTPVFTSYFTNVYYPKDGVSVRGQAELSWSLPTNSDGSFVTDGHHFELRYKPDTTADYSATWFEAGQGNWEDAYTWGQPTIPPILNGGWNTVYVGWDDESTVIQELTPGVDYIFQIRAVDSSTPQHFSEWSEDYVVSVAVDSIAPDKPAPPVVASSYLSIQVTHYLGKASGGTFNLPPDMAYLEVHVGPEAFYPDDTTRVGKIIADNGLIRSGTPVIQTFNIDSTDNVYVRVIAVDQTGNRSAPSNAVSSTINLIDDAHISDLTASKITAGTISSSILLSGVIKTAESGARAEMNFEGFRIFSEDDDATVSLLGNPGTAGNFLLIKDLTDPTQTLASIDGTGRGSFQNLEVINDVVINGENLIKDIIDPRAKGVVAIGTFNEASVTGAGAGAERGFLEISFIAEESRTYMISATTNWESTAANDRITMRLRDGGDSSPTLNSPLLQTTVTAQNLAVGFDSSASIIYAGTFTPGLHRILWSFWCSVGVAKVNPTNVGLPGNPSLIWVEDVGLPATDTVILNDAGVDEYLNPTTPDTKPPTPKPKITYTKNYSCTWSATYRSNGDQSTSHGSSMIHGDSGSDSWLNDARSLAGFNYQQIMNDTKGATIKACYITLYANHWYWNDGGTARIGTHNYTGKPSTWTGSRVDEQRVSSANWPKPGKRKVSLGTTIGNDFKSGAAKGIALGPTNGTKTQYGKFNGNGQANEPVLTIVYVK